MRWFPVCLVLSLPAGLGACSGGGTGSSTKDDGTATDSDPCDDAGDPSLRIGSVADGAYAPWGPAVSYHVETVGTETQPTLDIGFAEANLGIDTFATVHLEVGTVGGDSIIIADVPAGVACAAGVGQVGSMAIQWPWDSVAGQELNFTLTITDDDGRSATATATATVTGS